MSLSGGQPTGDFGELAMMAPDQPDEPQIDPITGLRDMAARNAVNFQNQQAGGALPPGVGAMKINSDGTMDFSKVNKDIYEGLVRDHHQLNEIRGAFHQEAERLKAKEAQLSTPGGAIGNYASVLAGNLASAPNMPGWVQGLGKTARELNPTAGEVRGQRLGIMDEEAKITEKSIGLGETAMRLQQQQLQHQATLDQKKNELELKTGKEVDEIGKRILSTARLASKNGVPLSEEAMNGIADAVDPRGVYPRDRIPGLLKANADMAAGADAAKEAELRRKVSGGAELAQIKGDVQQRVKDELIDRQGVISKDIAQMRINASGDFLKERYANMDARQAEGREFRAYQAKAEKGVEAVNNLRDATGRLRQLIAENPDAVGPIEGRIPELLLTRKQAEVRAEFFTLLDAVRQQISGGTRFWNPQEFQNLSPKLAAAKKTERVNMGIMDALDDFSVRGAKNIVKSNPDVDWQSRAPVFGDIADQVIGKNTGGLQGKAGGGRVSGEAPTTSRPASGAKSAAGPPEQAKAANVADEKAAAKAAKIGEIVTINGKQYSKDGANEFNEVK